MIKINGYKTIDEYQENTKKCLNELRKLVQNMNEKLNNEIEIEKLSNKSGK